MSKKRFKPSLAPNADSTIAKRNAHNFDLDLQGEGYPEKARGFSYPQPKSQPKFSFITEDMSMAQLLWVYVFFTILRDRHISYETLAIELGFSKQRIPQMIQAAVNNDLVMYRLEAAVSSITSKQGGVYKIAKYDMAGLVEKESKLEDWRNEKTNS